MVSKTRVKTENKKEDGFGIHLVKEKIILITLLPVLIRTAKTNKEMETKKKKKEMEILIMTVGKMRITIKSSGS